MNISKIICQNPTPLHDKNTHKLRAEGNCLHPIKASVKLPQLASYLVKDWMLPPQMRNKTTSVTFIQHCTGGSG